MLLRLCARPVVGRRSSWATSANSPLATVCSVTCNRSPAFSGSVLTERKHTSNLFATRWQRCAGVILLRSGVGGLPFGFSALMLLPVFLCARRTPGLIRDCWLGAGLAYPQLFPPFGVAFFVGRGRTVCAQSVDFCSVRIPAGSPGAFEVRVGLGCGVASCLCLVLWLWFWVLGP